MRLRLAQFIYQRVRCIWPRDETSLRERVRRALQAAAERGDRRSVSAIDEGVIAGLSGDAVLWLITRAEEMTGDPLRDAQTLPLHQAHVQKCGRIADLLDRDTLDGLIAAIHREKQASTLAIDL